MAVSARERHSLSTRCLQGIDSDVSAGLVYTPEGKLYGLVFDGDPLGQGGTSWSRQRVEKVLCPSPFQLYTNPNGRLNCFGKEVIHLMKVDCEWLCYAATGVSCCRCAHRFSDLAELRLDSVESPDMEAPNRRLCSSQVWRRMGKAKPSVGRPRCNRLWASTGPREPQGPFRMRPQCLPSGETLPGALRFAPLRSLTGVLTATPKP
jgi:hypothetical protein